MKINKLLYGLIIIVLGSCNSKSGTDNFSSVPHRSVNSSLVFESDSTIFIGNTNLFNVFDSLIFIYDRMDSYAFTMYNINTNKAKKIIPLGQGPGEIVNPSSLLSICKKSDEDSYLVVYEHTTKKQYFYPIDSLCSLPDIKYSYSRQMEDDFDNNGLIMYLMYLNDSMSIANVLNVDTIFSLYKNGKKYSSYPDPIMADDMKGNTDKLKAQKYTNIVNISPSGKILMRSSLDGGIIDAYQINDNRLKKLFAHVYFYPNINRNLCSYGYISICSDDNQVYGLYSGKNMKESSKAFNGNEVHVYDLQGNLVEILDLDTPASGIRISDKGDILYAITNTGEKRIISFKIKKESIE